MNKLKIYDYVLEQLKSQKERESFVIRGYSHQDSVVILRSERHVCISLFNQFFSNIW